MFFSLLHEIIFNLLPLFELTDLGIDRAAQIMLLDKKTRMIERQNNPSNISLDVKLKEILETWLISFVQLLSVDCYVGYAIAEKQNSKENR